MSIKAFKPRKLEVLTETETVAAVNSWQQNLEFHIASCDEFAPFIDSVWEIKSVPHRGLTDDTEGTTRKTSAQKCYILNHLLGLIVSYCPENIRLEIDRKATSLKWIWNRVRRHYGFTKSEGSFLKLSNISKLGEGERYETFFQRIMSHLYDNLLTTDSGIIFDGAEVNEDEAMSPTTERLAVYLWLTSIDSRLPMYVSRVYAHDLMTKSLKDLQPQICQNLDSLLMELSTQEEIKINYSRLRNNKFRGYSDRNPQRPGPSSQKSCAFCKACKKAYLGHDINSCWQLSKFDKAEIAKAFNVAVDVDADVDTLDVNNFSVQDSTPNGNDAGTSCSRVLCMKSPFFYCYYNSTPCKVVVDSGAESNIISLAFVQRANIRMMKACQSARQLDKSMVKTPGEVNIELQFGNIKMKLCALVVENMDSDILAGVPFCRLNDVEFSFKKEEIYIQGRTIQYGSHCSARQPMSSSILRNSSPTVIYPGEFLEVSNPAFEQFGCEVAIEPRQDSPHNGSWPEPEITRVIDCSVRIPNRSEDIIFLSKNQHFGQINQVLTVDSDILETYPDIALTTGKHLPALPAPVIKPKPEFPFSDSIPVDPRSQLTTSQKQAFIAVNKKFDSVFNPNFTGYNDYSGAIRAKITIGAVPPPPQKAKLPFYNQANLQLLQSKADDLEDKGVLVTPESVNMTPIHISPSFLVKKANGDWRYVTAFNDIGKFCRLPPSKVTKCNDILQKIGSFKYIIKSDLTSSFFQLKVSPDSMPYLGTVTPFKGIRLYARAAMGMPGSSEWLDELMSRVVGNMVMDDKVLLIADDLYVGANTVEELLTYWEELLAALSKNNLVLSASKTVIAPVSTVILGWIWKNGTLSPSDHKICALRKADPPKTCTAMKSFLGAYKDIARSIQKSASFLSPLDAATSGLSGKDQIQWTDELRSTFDKAKAALDSISDLAIPSSSDKLIITVDASPLNKGLGATLFVMRNGKKLVAEYFSFKMKSHQISWLPCEVEALAICTAVTHFSPYIRESHHTTQVLTDSKPCVQAWEKLRRGCFSASARVSTFLCTLSSSNVSLCHIKGSDNCISDYASRNPLSCSHENCQICKFVLQSAESVVHAVSAGDILKGTARMPYTNFSAWRSAQQSDDHMRKAFAHLKAGTRPSKKSANAEIKSIIRLASIDETKGILIVRKQDPYVGNRDLIFCPTNLAHGLVLALHIYFTHPSKCQIEKLFDRHFYALNSSKVIETVTANCEVCNSLKAMPREMFQESSSSSAVVPGEKLAADVICRKKQKILVVRDCLTSFTSATFISNETAPEYRNALILCCLPIKFDNSIVRVDCAPALSKLANDYSLSAQGIFLDLGNPKNINKNPVAEKANQELEKELLKVDPTGNPVSAVVLLQAIRVLNSRIRSSGLSSREMLLGRDQVTGHKLKVTDKQLSRSQEATRKKNHGYSAKCKARGGPPAKCYPLPVGTLVYIKGEGDKFNPREPYIVVRKEKNNVLLQKSASSGLLSSKQYWVPCSKVFPVIPLKKAEHKDVTGLQADSSDSSNSDLDVDADNAAVQLSQSDSDSSSSSDSDLDPQDVDTDNVVAETRRPDPDVDSVNRPADIPQTYRRSTRNRSKPQRYGVVPNNDQHSDSADDLIPSWYPGWDKDRTREYINRYNDS